jgi:hypothetical protein
MLDDVQRRRFFEKPARENFAPFVVGTVNDQLDECAGKLVFFPRLRLVARFQAHNSVADVDGIAGAHLQIAGQAVPLVQYADRRDTFRHRCCGANFSGRRLGGHVRDQRSLNTQIVSSDRRATCWSLDNILNRRRSRRETDDRKNSADRPAIHAASGLHAS